MLQFNTDSLGENVDIDEQLFKNEAFRGERTSLKFRWLLIIVVMAFILITYIRGDKKEALLSFIPAGIFLVYNLYMTFLLKRKKNVYFLRYFSVSIDIIALSAIFILIHAIFHLLQCQLLHQFLFTRF